MSMTSQYRYSGILLSPGISPSGYEFTVEDFQRIADNKTQAVGYLTGSPSPLEKNLDTACCNIEDLWVDDVGNLRFTMAIWDNYNGLRVQEVLDSSYVESAAEPQRKASIFAVWNKKDGKVESLSRIDFIMTYSPPEVNG